MEEKSEKEVAGLPINKNSTHDDLNVPNDYRMDDLPKKEESEQIENIELIYPTSHLRGFKELMESTRLEGKEYILIIKAIWYGILSCKNTEINLKLNRVETDGRIHLLIPLKSGKGKKELKRVLKEVMNGIGKTVDEPTSLHPEQLVGKTVKKNRKGQTEYENIEGYFSRDYLIIDEGRTLLTSNEIVYSESRRYLRLALDPYPHNTITKRPVDVPFGEELEYTPYFGCCIYTQPYDFDEEFATDGDLRRFVVPYVNMSGINRAKAYQNRVLRINDSKDSLNKFIHFLSSLKDYKEYTFSKNAKVEFLENFDILVERGFSYSIKVRNFVDLYDFTIQDLLLKMSYVQALQNGENEINENHIALASIDLFEFLEHLYQFVENKIHGSLDYGEGWNGATNNDKELLRWLNDQNALSKDTSQISIREYQKKIQRVFNVEERQSVNIKQKHERNKWIKSKKGAHNSFVWLGFKPEVRGARPAMQSRNFSKLYQDKIKNYITNAIAPLAPLEDIPFKNVSDEELQSIASDQNNPDAPDALNELGLRQLKQKNNIVKGTNKYYKENLNKILKCAHDVLKLNVDSGIAGIAFRDHLGELLDEDEDKFLLYYERKMLEDKWLLQSKAGAPIRPSSKLIQKFQSINDTRVSGVKE